MEDVRTIDIYNKSGELEMSAPLTDSSSFSESIMSMRQVDLSWIAEEAVDIPAMSYVMHDGDKFFLIDDYIPDLDSSGFYSYTPTFVSAQYLLVAPIFKRILSITDPDTEETSVYIEPEFTLNSTIETIAGIAIEAIEDSGIFGSDAVIEFIDNTENSGIYKSLTFDGVSIYEALDYVAGEFETEWYISRSINDDGEEVYTIYFGEIENNIDEPIVLSTTGENPAIVSISVESDYTKPPKRLVVFGSERNISSKTTEVDEITVTYDNRLRLDDDMVIDEDSAVADIAVVKPNSVIEFIDINNSREEVVTFENVYPMYEGTVTGVRSESLNSDGTTLAYFIADSNIDFDVKMDDGVYADGEYIMIQFTSGVLNGYSFQVGYNSAAKEFEIIRNEDSGTYLPTSPMIPAVGDTYIPYNFAMPDEYIERAKEELLLEAVKYVAELTDYIPQRDCTASQSYLDENNITLKIGDRITVDGYTSRITAIDYPLVTPNACNFTLDGKSSSGRLDALQAEINSNAEANKPIITQLNNLVDDGKLTPVEKANTLIPEWNRIKLEYASALLSIDKTLGLTDEVKSSYKAAYASLETYITPIVESVSGISQINQTEYTAKFTDYYAAYQATLYLEKIAVSSFNKNFLTMSGDVTTLSDKLAQTKITADAALPSANFTLQNVTALGVPTAASVTAAASAASAAQTTANTAKSTADAALPSANFTLQNVTALGVPTAASVTAAASAAIANTVIGGVNLLRGSDYKTNTSAWYISSMPSLNTDSDGTEYITFTYEWGVRQYTYFEAGKNYVFSAYIRRNSTLSTSTTTPQLRLSFHDAGGAGSVSSVYSTSGDITDEWKKVTFSFVYPTHTFTGNQNIMILSHISGVYLDCQAMMIEEGTKASASWRAAPEDTKYLIAEADAKGQAYLDELSGYDDDGVITPTEKVAYQNKWKTIYSEYSGYISSANTYNVSTTDYTSAYTSLNTYLNGSSGLLLDLTSTSSVNVNTVDGYFTSYYSALSTLSANIQIAIDNLAQGYVANLSFSSVNLLDGSAKFSGSTTSFYKHLYATADIGVLNPIGETYTLRCLNNGDNTIKIAISYFYDTSFRSFTTSIAPLKTGEVTFTVGDDFVDWRNITIVSESGSGEAIGDYLVEELMLVKGNKIDGSWSPSAEDTNKKITAVETLASTASTTASAASTTAASALSTANSASSTAATASTNATTALSTANGAASNASTALTKANAASTLAGTANETANSAATTAEATATSLITFTGGKTTFDSALSVNNNFKSIAKGDFFAVLYSNHSSFKPSGSNRISVNLIGRTKIDFTAIGGITGVDFDVDYEIQLKGNGITIYALNLCTSISGPTVNALTLVSGYIYTIKTVSISTSNPPSCALKRLYTKTAYTCL